MAEMNNIHRLQPSQPLERVEGMKERGRPLEKRRGHEEEDQAAAEEEAVDDAERSGPETEPDAEGDAECKREGPSSKGRIIDIKA